MREIVATIASKSAGPGTRQNIDEFTDTTARGLERIGASKGKAIIVLNPAEPPILMRNTIYGIVEDSDPEELRKSIEEMVARIQEYVPGYRLSKAADREFARQPAKKSHALCGGRRRGDYLPRYAGNLDIMTFRRRSKWEKKSPNISGLEHG
jgi:acetaldehyde dehydrogenase